MADYLWKPIEPLSEQDRQIDLSEIRRVYETWRTAKKRLQQSSPTNLKLFNQRLIRRLSIETGILERLYDLDRGTTEALVTQGFVEDLVSRAGTDLEPSRLIDILRDQEAAIQLTIDCVAGRRDLTNSVVHELHAILTRHQDATTAIDQFGNRHEIPLVKGAFKSQPNNPRRPEGDLHEYCPPVHVGSEMDNLLAWFSSYGDEDPLIAAAWLHHRLTQIHPYQDGNGRVARALTTLALLRADLQPLVIDRDLRVEYINALESADRGDLSNLALLFARLERGAMLQALSVDADAEISHQRTLTSAVIESLAAKFNKRREAKSAELKTVNTVAKALRTQANHELRRAFDELRAPIAEVADPDIFIADGGSDHGNSHWYKFDVIQSAREVGKFANFGEDHYFVKASIRAGQERLVFVTSFHHVGRELTGIMEAVAFSHLESYEGAKAVLPCSLEPFVFTHKTSVRDAEASFSRWLDAALAVALKEYGDRL